MAQKGIAFLQVEGNGVVNLGSDAPLVEELSETVSFRSQDHILIVDVAILILSDRKLESGQGCSEIAKEVFILFGLFLSFLCPLFEKSKLNEKDGCLKGIETAVDSN